MIYTREDERHARIHRNKCIACMIAAALPLLAVYGLGAVKGIQWLMLAALLSIFAGTILVGDLWLVPAIRYVRFLREMNAGLRRNVSCVLLQLEDEPQLQDGVRVRLLHVRIREDGSSRIFYINASKTELLPDMQTTVRLVSYGRHVLECEVV